MIYVTESQEGHIFVAVALQDAGEVTRSLELATGASGNIPQAAGSVAIDQCWSDKKAR